MKAEPSRLIPRKLTENLELLNVLDLVSYLHWLHTTSPKDQKY